MILDSQLSLSAAQSIAASAGDVVSTNIYDTGATAAPGGSNVQSICYATSPDLYEWTKGGQILSADPQWYEKLSDGQWHDEAFRDPWVFADPNGDGWHLLITARANHGPADDRGVVGHATSPDLVSWTLQPPLSEPGQGYGQLEVFETVRLEGRDYLVFNCLAGDLSAAHRATGTTGGVWLAPAESPLGPYDLAGAQQLTDHTQYVGRFVHDRSGHAVFLAFRNVGPEGGFVGSITDPQRVVVNDAQVVIEGALVG